MAWQRTELGGRNPFLDRSRSEMWERNPFLDLSRTRVRSHKPEQLKEKRNDESENLETVWR
jgi:hypothetical protein